MSNCLFCEIVENKSPSYKVYEDDFVLAFLDIFPVNSGHILVIPKKHYANFEEVPEDILCKMICVVKFLGKELKTKLGVSGYNVCENNDKISGQLVPHIHFHIIPRTEDDGCKSWNQGKYQEGEAEDILKKLKSDI